VECRFCGKLPDLDEDDEWVGVCPECDQLHQDLMMKYPGSNPGWLARTLVKSLQTRATIEDVEWLLDAGETDAKAIVARLAGEPKVRTVERLLNRHGRTDLVRRIGWTERSEVRRLAMAG
jgi:hypothetical protein